MHGGLAGEVYLRHESIARRHNELASRRAPRRHAADDPSARASVQSLFILYIPPSLAKRSEEVRYQHTPRAACRTGHPRAYIRWSTCELRISSSRRILTCTRIRIRTLTRLRVSTSLYHPHNPTPCSPASPSSPPSPSPTLRPPPTPAAAAPGPCSAATAWRAYVHLVLPFLHGTCADNDLGQSDSAAGSALLSLLGVDLKGVTAQLGLGCSPISAIGVGSGNACASNAVCCQNNNVVSVLRICWGCLKLTDTFVNAGRSHLHWLRADLPLDLVIVLAASRHVIPA